MVAYNLENLFDVDGFALYQDYTQDEVDDPFTYTRRKLLTKLENAARVLASFNEGAGPEIILFQEFEADFTPESGTSEFDAFLKAHVGTTVEAMLTDGWQAEFAGISSTAWMLKTLSDAGMRGYEVVNAPAKPVDAGMAHTNAVFSKFPILSVERHPLEQARDILEVEIDVDGNRLVLYDNHWKSGASNPNREPLRVQNAHVLRGLIEARLAKDPDADIIIGGDLNSHYNHDVLYPDIQTGINGVLGSQGDESFAKGDLYNLWFELSPEERYSEVWRGRRGTLMHLLLTSGLYDNKGISYIDGSFDKLRLTGLNADAIGRPLEWNFAGSTGGGASDHFPVYARFTTRSFEAISELSRGDDALDYEMRLDYASGQALELEDGAFLKDIPDAELGEYIGRFYTVPATVRSLRPFKLDVRGTEWSAYTPNPELRPSIERGEHYELVVTLGIWKGKRQLLVEGIR